MNFQYISSRDLYCEKLGASIDRADRVLLCTFPVPGHSQRRSYRRKPQILSCQYGSIFGGWGKQAWNYYTLYSKSVEYLFCPVVVRYHRSTTDHLFCIRQMLEKKREYNEAVHQLFIDFKKLMIQLGGRSYMIFLWRLGSRRN